MKIVWRQRVLFHNTRVQSGSRDDPTCAISEVKKHGFSTGTFVASTGFIYSLRFRETVDAPQAHLMDITSQNFITKSRKKEFLCHP